jgi:hypothetical protein
MFARWRLQKPLSLLMPESASAARDPGHCMPVIAVFG